MHKNNMTRDNHFGAAPFISGKIKSINQEIIDDDIDDVPNDSSP
jgi:hypothetical protein